MKAAIALGITLFAGEAENRLDDLLAAAFENRLQPLLQLHERPAFDGGIHLSRPSRTICKALRGCAWML